MTNFKPLPPLDVLRELYELDAEAGQLINRRTGKPVGFCGWEGYGRLKVRGSLYRIHRVVYLLANGVDPGASEIDHINGDRADNRPENLRLADSKTNQWNVAAKRTSSHGLKGVTRRRNGAFMARIRCGERRVYLGIYLTAEEAHAAYAAAAQQLHGEYARAA